jgi:hypothetical protein
VFASSCFLLLCKAHSVPFFRSRLPCQPWSLSFCRHCRSLPPTSSLQSVGETDMLTTRNHTAGDTSVPWAMVVVGCLGKSQRQLCAFILNISTLRCRRARSPRREITNRIIVYVLLLPPNSVRVKHNFFSDSAQRVSSYYYVA